jgi:UDP-glucose 4-epimerase
MKVLVTGGAGFIGANLARHLISRSHSVVVVDDLSTGNLDNISGLAVDFVEASILDRDATMAAARDVDAVVHLAARPSVPRSIEDPALSNEVNVTGTINVLDAARTSVKLPHVVVASSSSVYGANPTLPKVETLRPQPVSPYAVSKLAAEGYALSYQQVFGLPALAFRFFNVYGPLQPAGHAYAAVIPAFIDAALKGEPLPVHGDGTQTRDFTYVGTVAAVITDALEKRITRDEPVNLAFGSRRTLLEAIDELEDILGRELERAHSEPRAGDVRDSQADQTTLRALFPTIEPTPFRDGLTHTVDWFREVVSTL